MERQPDNWQRVDQHIDQPISMKIERGQKGNYGWEVRIYGDNILHVVSELKDADDKLKELFAGGDNAKSTA